MTNKTVKYLSLGVLLGLSQLSHAGQLVQIDSELRQTLEILIINGVVNVDISTWPIS